MLFGLLSVDKNLFWYVVNSENFFWLMLTMFDSVLQPSEVRWLIIFNCGYVLLIIGNLWSNYKSFAAIIAAVLDVFPL